MAVDTVVAAVASVEADAALVAVAVDSEDLITIITDIIITDLITVAFGALVDIITAEAEVARAQ